MSTGLDASSTNSTAPAINGGRSLLGYLALALPAWLLVLDTLVALAWGWRPESRAVTIVLGLALAWLLITSLGYFTRRGNGWFAACGPQLLLLAISVALAVGVTELVLRPLRANLSGPFHGRRPGTQFHYRPLAGVMPGVGPEAHVQFNSWGVRGSEPPAREDAYRIICLGGSSTACTYLDDAKAWPHLLQEDLNAAHPDRPVWVGNLGLPGYRSDHHLQFVQTSPLVEQIDCLVLQAGINDFMACLMGPQPAAPHWTHLQIWQLASDLARNASTSNSGTQVEDSAGAVYQRRRAMRAASPIESAPPEIDRCLKQFGSQLAELADACQKRGIRLVLTTQPVLWRDQLEPELSKLVWFGQLPSGRYLSIEQLRAGMDRYNDVVRQVAQELNVELVDLDALSGDGTAFYDDCHFTEAGSARVAQIIAERLEQRPTPERASSP